MLVTKNHHHGPIDLRRTVGALEHQSSIYWKQQLHGGYMHTLVLALKEVLTTATLSP